MSEYLGLVIERREKDMKPCDHPKGYYHGNGDSYCPDCEFFFTAQHHISLLMKRIATQQARIEALEAEIAGFTEDVKLPDIEAVTRCRIRARKISRLQPPEQEEQCREC